MPTFDDFLFVDTRRSLKEMTLEHRPRHDLRLVIPAHVVDATAPDRYWVRSVYPTLPTALAEVEVLRGLHAELSPMTRYYGLCMRSFHSDHLTWRMQAALWAQAAAGMMLTEASDRVQFSKLY